MTSFRTARHNAAQQERMVQMQVSPDFMNPVRSLAPDLVRGDLGTAWIYVVGPVLGALIGVAFEWILKGKPSTAGTLAAQGTIGADDSTQTRE